MSLVVRNMNKDSKINFLNGCLQILSENNERILAFEENLKTEFEKELLEAAFYNLLDLHNPLRFNNFSYAIRELLDHILRRLAPSEYVVKCTWYSEPDSNRKVVRTQRVKYAIQKGLSDEFISTELKLDISGVQRNIRDIISKLNKYTHVAPDTFNITPQKQLEDVSIFLQVFLDLFEIIQRTETEIIESMIKHIEEEVIETIFDNYSELETYVTHAYFGDYDINDITLAEIDYEHLEFLVEGSISPEFQIGSDSDVRRGDGMVFTKTIPFTCRLSADVLAPYDLKISDFEMEVNSDNFWEGIEYLPE